MEGWMNEWVDGWMDSGERMDGRIDYERMSGWMS
jgi:hypothetical protein